MTRITREQITTWAADAGVPVDANRNMADPETQKNWLDGKHMVLVTENQREYHEPHHAVHNLAAGGKPSMNQSRIDSVMEITVNTAIGLAIATAANAVVLPAVLGVRMTGSQNVLIAGIFTVISLIRSYAIRRAFNGRSPWMWLRGRFRRHGRVARVTYLPGRFDWRSR